MPEPGRPRPLQRPGGSRGPTAIVPAEAPGLRALLTLQVGVVVVAALYFGAEICIPVVLAVLLSFLLQPLNALLRRARVGRWPSAALSVLTALGLIAALLWLIGTQLMGLGHDLAADQPTIARKLASLHQLGAGPSSDSVQRLRDQIEQLAAGPSPPAQATSGATAPKPEPVEIVTPPPSALSLAGALLSRLAHPLATALIVFVVSIFILLQREDLRDRVIRLFGTRDLHRTTLALDDAGSRLSRYFLTQLAINFGFGCLISGGLFLIGIPSPFLWGVLAMLLRFVPYVGTMLAAIPPVLLAASSFPGWDGTIETLALFLLVEPMVAQFVEPLLIGHSTGLSPFSVIVAATFWTWLWGPIGLILSTPLTLCSVVLGRHVERLEFLAVLLGDQPALSPVESFYQRMLADDPDEIEEQAEALLAEVPLSTYYDEVVIPGLELGSLDIARGVVEDEHLARMKEALVELVGSLEHHSDADRRPDATAAARPMGPGDDPDDLLSRPAATGMLEPDRALPAWRTEHPVLCVPGSGPLDEEAASIVVQILGKHGIGARLVTNNATSRAAIGSLELGDAALVCLCALGIESRLAPLRYTARRLRQRAPDLPIAVAFWPGQSPDETQRRMRGAVGADHHHAALREIVATCLALATGERLEAAEAA